MNFKYLKRFVFRRKPIILERYLEYNLTILSIFHINIKLGYADWFKYELGRWDENELLSKSNKNSK